jgi:lactobin A/cerein 7B family class IIb bacteriocin
LNPAGSSVRRCLRVDVTRTDSALSRAVVSAQRAVRHVLTMNADGRRERVAGQGSQRTLTEQHRKVRTMSHATMERETDGLTALDVDNLSEVNGGLIPILAVAAAAAAGVAVGYLVNRE